MKFSRASYINIMNWDDLRIAYAPYHKDLTAPGDRRRFVFYANERKIKFDIADLSKKYDIVYLTYGCNISAWIEYKKKNPEVKLVFELIDSYLLENTSILTIFRGATRYLLKKENKFWLDYKVALHEIIKIVDAVVCSTQAQKVGMLEFNKNVYTSLDYFSNDINYRKTSLKNSKKFKLVWEGQAHTVNNLLVLNDVFERLDIEFELYIITDPVIKSKVDFFDKKTSQVLSKLKCKYYFLNWNKFSFSENIANADLAIIPIFSNKSMMWNKPENKLLLMWEIGIPTLTSTTPAYKQVMDAAGLNMYCSSSNDWVKKIEEYMKSPIQHRISIVKKANDYLREFHNKNRILKNWDEIFNSL